MKYYIFNLSNLQMNKKVKEIICIVHFGILR